MSVGGADGAGADQARLRRVQKAEREAQERITLAQKRVNEAEKSAAKRIDEIRDYYQSAYETEQARLEAHAAKKKEEGYENLSGIKRQFQKEAKRTRAQSDKELNDLKAHYENSIYEKKRAGDKAIEQLRVQSQMEADNLRRQAELEQHSLLQEQGLHLEQMKERQNERVQELYKDGELTFKQAREKHDYARKKTAEMFLHKANRQIAEQEKTQQNIQAVARDQLQAMRQDITRKLAAYETRAADPFYSIVDIGADLHEAQDAYYLVITTPEFEKDKISVSVQEKHVMISGTRENEDELELGPNRVKKTSSYQSFSETFPLEWPVDRRGMTKEVDGNTTIYRLPKKGPYEAVTHTKKRRPKPIESFAPEFPRDLKLPQDGEPKSRVEYSRERLQEKVKERERANRPLAGGGDET